MHNRCGAADGSRRVCNNSQLFAIDAIMCTGTHSEAVSEDKVSRRMKSLSSTEVRALPVILTFRPILDCISRLHSNAVIHRSLFVIEYTREVATLNVTSISMELT